MPRRASSTSIDALVREAMDEAIDRAAQDISRVIAEMAADELTAQLEAKVVKPQGRPRAARRPAPAQRSARGDLNRWVADRRARRVPTFVIDLTGLDTKKKIVARYGQDAAFEKGKPAPRARG
jgi:hypothetical protein